MVTWCQGFGPAADLPVGADYRFQRSYRAATEGSDSLSIEEPGHLEFHPAAGGRGLDYLSKTIQLLPG